MGDEILKPMHILLLSMLVAFSSEARTLSLSDETAVYETLFETINQKRFGLSDEQIRQTRDPFIKIYPDTASKEGEVKREPAYRLHAIFNNRAKINDTWLERGDMIGSYRLSAIGHQDVTLASPNQTLKLTLSSKGKNNVVVSFK